MGMTITRRATFNAAHRLFRADWTDEQNFAVFGPCSNPEWHGHNYILEVTVGGEADPNTGMIVDLKWVKEIVQRDLLDLIDHKNLNTQVDFLKGTNPTVEQLARCFWKRLAPTLNQHCKLIRVTLHETENNVASYDET